MTGCKAPAYAVPLAGSGTAVDSATGGDAVHLRSVSVVKGGSLAAEDAAVPGAGRMVLVDGRPAVPLFGDGPLLAVVADTVAFWCAVLVGLFGPNTAVSLMPASGAAGDQTSSLE